MNKTEALEAQKMTSVLTSDMIAAGWKLHDGKTIAVKSGTVFQFLARGGGISRPTNELYKNGYHFFWTDTKQTSCDYVAYRTFSPDIPRNGEALEALDKLLNDARGYAIKFSKDPMLHNARSDAIRDYITSLEAEGERIKADLAEAIGCQWRPIEEAPFTFDSSTGEKWLTRVLCLFSNGSRIVAQCSAGHWLAPMPDGSCVELYRAPIMFQPLPTPPKEEA